MIDEIHIRDLALIREASFVPSSGLTVVTGETGAGKTALLNAIKLLIGERADAGFIREGCDELKVEGRFVGLFHGGADMVGESARAEGVDATGESAGAHSSRVAGEGTAAEGAGATSDGADSADPDAEIVVARRVGARGRSRATINGSLASLKEVAASIGQSVDLCGQHEHQRLLSPVYQRVLLDAWGADTIGEPLACYQEAFHQVAEARAEVERLRALESADSVALDRARFALEQINAVDPQEGEYEDLLAALPRLENSEMLMEEATAAQRGIAGSDGVLEKLGEVMVSLDRIAAVDSGVGHEASVVREAYYSLEDLGRTLATYRDQVDFPQEELEATQDRLAELQGLMRGFGPRLEDVFALRAESQARLAEYEGRDELIAQAQAVCDEAEAHLEQAAHALRQAREAVIPQFVEAVTHQMARLEMGTARLEGNLEDLPREQWSTWGPHTFELMFAAGAEMHPQQLSRIASGGEMSRVMLALKVVLGSCDDVDTLVFDEIDAGTGGHTARALGAVLEDLARTHQVIVVTHLPQVAVRGQVHYLVTKTNDAVPETCLRALQAEERAEEIARMLAGEVNATSLAHARELLEGRA